MTYEESEDMSFRLSRVKSLVKIFASKGELDQSINKLRGYLEKNMQGLVKTSDLANLQTRIKERMGPMEHNIGRIVKRLQHQGEKIPKEVKVDQGTHE